MDEREGGEELTPVPEVQGAESKEAATGVAARRPFWRRHRWLIWTGAAVVAFLVIASVVLSIAARRVEPYLRARIVEGLADHFHTKVELDSFHVSVHHGKEAMFGIWATGRGLRIWPPHREGGDHPLETAVQSEPLIQLEEFSFHVPLRRYSTGKPVRIPEVRLKGLVVRVPPRSERDRNTGLQSAMSAEAPPAQKQEHGIEPANNQGMLSNVLVQAVVCENAELVLETDKPNKLPLTFEIAKLKLKHLIPGEGMQFDAELTNARPKGLIQSSGSFGPWNIDDPGMSPVSGKYSFQHADLADFKGIAGILSSNGTYEGTLRALKVDGETMVPDFRLSQFGGKLPLHTNFHARVDGTNGDTYLDRVDAVLGRSQFTVTGKVVRVKPPEQDTGKAAGAAPDAGKPAAGKPVAARAVAAQAPVASPETDAEAIQPGHLIDVNVTVPHGQIDDFVRLVSKSGTPLMTGELETQATLHIPPGDEPVHLRMKLDGHFKLNDARFTSEKFQQKVEDLSYHGLGRPDKMKHADPKSVTSEMESDFHIADGVATLPNLQYSVPGALIELHGTYALSGEIHMDGTARMQATVSQMVGGWKGFLLKPVDRFFKKDGAGTLVGIKVRGTREQPDFGVDLGAKSTHPERPR